PDPVPASRRPRRRDRPRRSPGIRTCPSYSPSPAPARSGAELKDPARELAALEIFDRMVDVFETVLPRDQLVDLEAPSEVQVGEHRKIVLWTSRTVPATEDRLVNAQRIDEKFGAGGELRHPAGREPPARR